MHELQAGPVVPERQTEQALQRERAFLHAVLENMVEGVVAFDLEGNVTYRNRVAREMDCQQDPIARGDWARAWQIFHADGTTAMRDEELPLWRVLRGERAQNEEIVLTSRATQRTYRLLVSGQALSEGGARTGAVITLLDVTERRDLEAQFSQAQKMQAVGRLAGGVAHDFNNILTTILGYSDQLLDGLQAAPGAAREAALEIRRASERAAALTRQLLSFSRKQLAAPRVLDLNAVVGDMEKMLRRTIGEDIRLSLRLQSGLGAVRADPVQLEQVLLNLAVNARDAMAPGDLLVLETCAVTLDEGRAAPGPGPYVLLAVHDTGCGMTPEVQAHLFEPFFTTKEVGKGSGLGLATVYGIVQQSGGHIEVDSRPGQGTTVKVYFPRVDEPVPPAEPVPEARELPGGHETLCLVEDDLAVRQLERLTLQAAGYTVLDVGHPGEALQLALGHKQPIDLLVTDVVLPMLGGGRLADKLRALHPEMKVLFVSGHTHDVLARHGVRHDRLPFLQKPFTPLALARKVRQVLDA